MIPERELHRIEAMGQVKNLAVKLGLCHVCHISWAPAEGKMCHRCRQECERSDAAAAAIERR